MPFKSEKQRRYLHANHPDIAKRWEQEYSGGGIARLGYAYGDLVDDMMTQRTPLGNLMVENTNIERPTSGYEDEQRRKEKDDAFEQLRQESPELFVDSGMFGTDATYIPRNTAADMAANFYQFDDVESQDSGMFEEKDEDVDFINRIRNINAMRKYAMPAYNFIKGNVGAGLTGLINPLAGLAMFAKGRKNSDAYRPATGSVGGYSVPQLNQMNALGGYYSEPARNARRTKARIDNMMARKAAGKSYSQKNLNKLTLGSRPGHYDRPGGDRGNNNAGVGNQGSRGGAPSHSTRDLMFQGGLASLWQK